MQHLKIFNMFGHSHQNRHERGNVFLFIFLGIALFAALSFTVSRTFSTQNTSSLSKRDAVLAASQIVDFASDMRRAFNRLSRKGCLEGDFSLDTPALNGLGYANGNAPTDLSCHIFEGAGGGVTFQNADQNWFDESRSALTRYRKWFFTQTTCIEDLGDDDTDCHSDGISNDEVLAVLMHLDQTLCRAINQQLGYGDIIPQEANHPAFFTTSTADFNFGVDHGARLEVFVDGNLVDTACFEGANNGDTAVGPESYHFYSVIMPR